MYAKLASQAYDKALQIDSTNPAAKNKLALVRELVGGNTPSAAAVAAAKPPVVVATAPTPAPAPAAHAFLAPAPAAKEPAKAEPAKVEPAKPAVIAAVEPKARSRAWKKTRQRRPASPTSSNAEILETVNGWAKAWSSQNVDAYLAYYGKDFKTPGGESRADWEKARRARISGPKSIHVRVEGPKVSMSGDQASVTFRQGYSSDVLKGANTTKTLVLAKSEGRWLIQQERVGN